MTTIEDYKKGNATLIDALCRIEKAVTLTDAIEIASDHLQKAGVVNVNRYNTSGFIVEASERLLDYWEIGGQKLPTYHVCLASNRGIWACGKSIELALNDLLRSHKENFPNGRDDIKVVYIGRR